MPSATVTGAHGQTVTLNFDSNANAALASRLAAAITAGVQNGSIIPAVDTDGPPPALPPGKTGEFVQTQTGSTILPQGYKAFVDTAPNSIVFGSGDEDETVLSSTGNLDFTTGGSGTVVAAAATTSSASPRGIKVTGRSIPVTATTMSSPQAAGTIRSALAAATIASN
jgi:hypothetical protein